ncbi:unnamed protein product, partial [Ixodes persulcatus]
VFAITVGLCVLIAIILFHPRKGVLREMLRSRAMIVKTNTGDVQAVSLKALNTTVYGFFGIPYARPPIGALRFSVTQRATPWEGVHSKTSGARCFQEAHQEYFGMTSSKSYDEDCLLMDVYVPASRISGRPKAIVVVLHGGSFQTGSNRDGLYDGRFLAAAGDVIVAVPNYRLNVLGFWRSHQAEAPGNQGLWDQLFAIQWMNANAKAFGGRSGSLTILGIDSGAVSAGLHLLSPVSRQFFSRVIMQGGSPFRVGEFHPFAEAEERRSLVNSVCKKSFSNDSDELHEELINALECLRNVSVTTLLDTLGDFNGVQGRMFGPSYSQNTTDDPFFIPEILDIRGERSETSITLSNKDLLIGYSVNEGEYFLNRFFQGWSLTSASRFPRSFIQIFLDRLVLHYFSMPLLNEVRKFYFDRNSSNVDAYLQATAFLGDVNVLCPAKLMADHVSRMGGNVHMYELNYNMKALLTTSDAPPTSKSSDWLGATHYADAILSMGALFGGERQGKASDALDTSLRLMGKWAAFARSG